MVHVVVIGGGPAGLSSALFTAKNGLETTLFDTDRTWLHSAHLLNYLGIESIDGDVFLETARGQIETYGVEYHPDTAVTDLERHGSEFQVSAGDATFAADYVVLATGAKRDLAESLGCEFDDEVVAVDVTMETSVENAYATGAMVRDQEWQAVISAGDGAAAALNVLSKEKGEHFHDFDTPDDVE